MLVVLNSVRQEEFRKLVVVIFAKSHFRHESVAVVMSLDRNVTIAKIGETDPDPLQTVSRAVYVPAGQIIISIGKARLSFLQFE